MLISYRTRLFATAGLMVCTVLCSVVGLGWSRVVAFELERLDARLCAEARRIAAVGSARELERLVPDIAGKLRLQDPSHLLLQAGSGPAEAIVRAGPWPTTPALDAAVWVGATGFVARQRQPGPGGNAGTCSVATFEANAKPWRAARHGNPDHQGLVAADLRASQSELTDGLRAALAWVIPTAIGVTALGAWLLAALTLRPVNRLRTAMAQVDAKDWQERVSSAGEDREFKSLIETYNTMLERLARSFQQASRFSADAAHELKTPLTILQGRLELALAKVNRGATADTQASTDTGTTPADPQPGRQPSGDTDLQTDLTLLLDEVARLSAVTRKLLLLSQADAGQLQVQRTAVDLSALLHDVAADAVMVLEATAWQADVAPALNTSGDAVLLRQLFNNLLSNASRYGLAHGWVKLSARRTEDTIDVRFSNACARIAAGDRARFFDRFYRGDAAHNRSIDGSGLGLSLAREIARAHAGDLVLLLSPEDEVHMALSLPYLRA